MTGTRESPSHTFATGVFGVTEAGRDLRMGEHRSDGIPTPRRRLSLRTFAIALAVWLAAYVATALGFVLLAVLVQTTSGLLADPDTTSWWGWLERVAVISATLAVLASVFLVTAAARAGRH